MSLAERGSFRTECAVACFAACAFTAAARAQGVTRDNYYDFLPPAPRIVAQSRASALLHLYGDSADRAYRDVDPADGVDDARERRLLQLAEQFSPLMRRNNFSVPRDPITMLGTHPLLHVDTWQDSRRVRSDSVDLGAHGELKGDARLGTLFREFDPRTRRVGFERPEGTPERILFIDLPGDGPESWRAAYAALNPHTATRLFVHPFVHEHAEMPGSRRYELIFQYWFFYPFNNAVNTHEGDWEHINVSVTTLARAQSAVPARQVEALLSADDIGRAIAANEPLTLDSLVIGAVDYYFHQYFTTLDYIALAATDSGAGRVAPADRRYFWEDIDFVREAVRVRLAYAGGRLATHPIVFIGGNNKGPDELTAFRPKFGGALKRNSGASYPFSGTWQTVGPLDVTETVNGAVVPRLRAGTSAETPWHELIEDDDYVVFRAADIQLLPDWERLQELLEQSEAARRAWSWFVLPVYQGFPASPSLGSGLIKHVDFGNTAPMSPAYQSAWNRVRSSVDYNVFALRVLRIPISPTTPWATLRTGWGFWNVPFAVWGLLPGYNVVLMEAMPWAAGAMNIVRIPPPRTFSSGHLPRRFTTEGQGMFTQFGGHDFARLLPQGEHPIVSRFLQAHPGAYANNASYRRRQNNGPRLWFNLYFSDRFSVENTFSWSATDLSYEIDEATQQPIATVSGALLVRELTGGFRYDLASFADESVQLYTRAGYGWTWYSLSNLRLDAAVMDSAGGHGGYYPPLMPSRHWLPNSYYGGAGIEVFSPRHMWLFHRLGYGARLELSGVLHTLKFGDSEVAGRDRGTVRRGDAALSLLFGW
jgi:hypothetical protein